MSGKPKYTIGNKVGRLTIISLEGPNKNRNMIYKCLCDCGNTHIINGSQLGRTTSCGCLTLEKTTKHGLADKHPIYKTWQCMKGRCYCKTDPKWVRWGGRGIKVCDEWLNDFKAFYGWAMGNGWEKGLTIDRINNDGDYCPENCRWVTMQAQANNKRDNHIITYGGKTQNLKDWSEELKIKYSTLSQRINKRNWSIDRAFTTPVMSWRNV